jgi:uncharacterized membrane protein YfcA
MEFNNYFEVIILMFVISSYSIIQTLFGVGLLVFGTPTLLLMGYPFTTALFLLLPSSILLSALQIYVGKNQIEIKKEFILYSIPPMLLGLFIVASGLFNLNLKLIIGLVLLSITAVKTIKKYQNHLSKMFGNNVKMYMAVMGAIHGISNQGGGLLTLYFSTIYNDKLKIRSNIAFCYFTYGVFQLLYLLIFNFNSIALFGILLSAISILIFFTVGGKIFQRTSEQLFHKLISFAIVLFGIILIYGGLV